jgi:S-adenosylmethionine decarboxylase
LKTSKHSEQAYNLTRSLGFNAYQVLAANSADGLQAAVGYLNEKYDTDFLIGLLEKAADLIGAKVLNVSSEKYDPLGTSVALLLADGGHPEHSKRLRTNTLLGHLDKSHLTVHTYPQLHLDTGLCSLRLDLDLATCGTISPLTTLPLLFSNITCDLVTIDFRIRGYQLSGAGQIDFGSNEVTSIADYLPEIVLQQFQKTETNMPEILVYHTRMMRRNILPVNHVLPSDKPMELATLEQVEKHLNLLYTG